MTEKELLKNLSALKNITTDQTWSKQNRDVLSYQIFNGAEYAETTLGFFERLSLISKRVLQPTPIAALIAIFFVASGFFSLRASRNSTPGEPLYIAKNISEQAQFATTFDDKGKALLNVEFANQRIAEIEKVLSENQAKDANDARLKELASSFKNEIDSARARLAKIDTISKVTQPTIKTTTKKITTKDTGVVSAGSSKDKTGIDISTQSTQKTLAEAEKLFNEKNYSGATSKLDELDKQLK